MCPLIFEIHCLASRLELFDMDKVFDVSLIVWDLRLCKPFLLCPFICMQPINSTLSDARTHIDGQHNQKEYYIYPVTFQ